LLWNLGEVLYWGHRRTHDTNQSTRAQQLRR
jgi:hypothetical protein